jgi:hypothetical protein
MSQTPWDDPNVIQALRDGRTPSDISLLCCVRCGRYSYYNEGSHFSCQWCDWSAKGAALDRLLDADLITLDDYAEMQAEEPDVP